MPFPHTEIKPATIFPVHPSQRIQTSGRISISQKLDQKTPHNAQSKHTRMHMSLRCNLHLFFASLSSLPPLPVAPDPCSLLPHLRRHGARGTRRRGVLVRVGQLFHCGIWSRTISLALIFLICQEGKIILNQSSMCLKCPVCKPSC